ncbi:M48 family metallopeptidase [Sphingobium boeckii]|uniref:Peptidase M48 domain-containing protein n=1 Tax=Sphingobium boeckii TaxID=1082345 RepID=A0A7W9AIZ0_9SPHN|nr:M48 family metallopeptidase [Sphingobium boeckii]MBB5686542.1 hypothetical protein [Sphingobium boeckii]
MKCSSLGLLLLLSAHPAAAAKTDARATLTALQAMDMALSRVGYRLATANVGMCDRRQPASGLLLQGIEQYGADFRASAAVLFALGAAPGVTGVIAGSPADRAGIRANDSVKALNGAALPLAAGPGFDRMAAVLDRLETALVAGPVHLDLERAGQNLSVTLQGVPACASRFQVKSSPGFSAGANGRYVEVDAGLLAFADGDDEIAVIVAHELAHNILKHPETLNAQGVSRKAILGKDARRIRETEVEADRFSIRLLASAGYRLEAAPLFWARFGKAHGHGILSDSTHLRWKKRVALIEAEIAAVRAGP